MKKTRALVSIILCAVMLLAVAGCSLTKSDKQRIIGTWKTDKVDITDSVTESFKESMDEDQGKYFEFHDIAFNLVFDFKEDMSYSLKADEDSLREVGETIRASLEEGFRVMIDDLAAQNGLTVDQVLSNAGYSTVEEFIDEFANQEFVDSFVEQMVEDIQKTGKYTFQDFKLFLLDEEETGYTDKFDYKFSNEDSTLELTVADAEDAADYDFEFPLVLNKIG